MKRRSIFAAALLLSFTMTLFAGCAQQPAAAEPESVLSETGTLILRVNPEISVQYNKEGLVTKISGLNDDGNAVVSAYDDYIGKDCKAVVRDLVRKINEAGYFVTDVDGNSKNITIQIEPGSVLPQSDFLRTIAADVQVAVAGMNAKANVVDIGESDYDVRYAQANAPSGYITRDKAAEIALTHAGINASDAVFDDREFDFENGRPVYELEFMSGGQEYEYDIDAATGGVLRYLHGDSGYGVSNYDSNYGVTDYGSTNYDSGYGKTAQPPANTPPAPSANHGDSVYGDSNYDSGYGDSNYDSGYGNSDYARR